MITTSLEEQLDRQRLLLWISAAEFPRLFVDSVCRFTLRVFVALLLTRWRVACTKLLPIGNGDPDDDE